MSCLWETVFVGMVREDGPVLRRAFYVEVESQREANENNDEAG